jgi:SAM-dependent methyltransferase
METDKAWKLFGEVDPYYGVLTEEEYRADQLTDGVLEKFFATGEEQIAAMMTTVREANPGFTPARSLDFGCGPGRLAIPLARQSGEVLAVDVAPAMLAAAAKNARERGVDNMDFAREVSGRFDLVHSWGVFQHIPPRRGLRIMADMAARLVPDGMLVLQVFYDRDASAIRKLATVIKRREPFINGIANLAAGRRFGYPTMTVFCYPIPALLQMLDAGGLDNVRMTLDPPSHGYASLTVYAEKRRGR